MQSQSRTPVEERRKLDKSLTLNKALENISKTADDWKKLRLFFFLIYLWIKEPKKQDQDGRPGRLDEHKQVIRKANSVQEM